MRIEDNRKFKRFSASSVKVDLRLSFPHDTTLIDVSVEGLKISTNKNLRIGQVCTFRFESAKKPVTVKARTVWCCLKESLLREDGQRLPVYWAGLEVCSSKSCFLPDTGEQPSSNQ